MTGSDHSAVVEHHALYRQAESAYAAGDLARAESLLQQFLDLYPNHGASHHLLGKVLVELAAWEDALDHQRRSCHLHPELGWNWFAAGELHLRQGAWAEAVLSFEKAAAVLPTESWIRRRAEEIRLRQHCGGEDLTLGLGQGAYQYWLQHHEPRFPAPAMPLHDSWWWLDEAGRWHALHGGGRRPTDLPASAPSHRAPPWPCQGWVVLLDPRSRLRVGALQAVEAWLADQPSTSTPHLLYSDEDRLAQDGQRRDPWFKPQWCPESFLSTPWLDRLSLWRAAWLRNQGLPLPPSESAARFRWILDALSRDPVIGHVPRILVHQLEDPASPASHPDRSVALHEHLCRQGEHIVEVIPTAPEGYRLIWAVPRSTSCVLIIPTRDRADLLSPCLDSFWRTAATGDADLDVRIVVIDNGSQEVETARLLERWRAQLADRFTVLADPGSFNWSRINNSAAKLNPADILVFLNNDVEASSQGWLEAMAAQAMRPAIGCVGALLTYPDGSLQHGGVVVGMHGAADHAYRGLPLDHRVHRSRSSFLSNWGAVTGACMAVRRNLFELIGGFDEDLPVEFNDIDFCLRLGLVGYRHLVVPEAQLIHRESQSRDPSSSPTLEAALEIMRRRWKARLEHAHPWWPPACARDFVDGRPAGLQQ